MKTDVAPHTVLVLVGTYLPGYRAGGQIRSLANMVSALGEEFHFKILTLDRDLKEKSPFRGIVANSWVQVGQAEVMYLRPGLRGLYHTYSQLRSLDENTVLYLNSVFSRRFSMLALFMRRIKLCAPRTTVLAPRGELSLGALGIKSFRKSLYLGISRCIRLHCSLLWHASSRFEAKDILRFDPKARSTYTTSIITNLLAGDYERARNDLVIASDITSVPNAVQNHAKFKCQGQLRVVFVSRVCRMKNLSGAIQMLQNLSGDVSFNIYGPAEDTVYWRECQSLIARLPVNIRVDYRGELVHEKVNQVFAEHDLLLLPTRGENYGHVIAEALAAGCPVLISDQTPWRDLEVAGVGWDLPLSQPEKFQAVLQQCVDSDPEWYANLSSRALKYAVEICESSGAVVANRKLFHRAFASGVTSQSAANL